MCLPTFSKLHLSADVYPKFFAAIAVFCADLFELHDIIEREAQSTCNVIMFHKSLFQLVWPLVNFQSGICILGCNGHWRCPNHWQVCYDTWKQVKCHLWNKFSGIPSQPVKKIRWAIFFEHRKYKKVPGSSRFTLFGSRFCKPDHNVVRNFKVNTRQGTKPVILPSSLSTNQVLTISVSDLIQLIMSLKKYQRLIP